MSIVSSLNMPASNLLHPLVHNDSSSSLQRKRFLEDLDDNNDSKRSRTAPPSPPIIPSTATFRRRSLSPTPPSYKDKSSIITPESPVTQLAEPVNIEKATPILSVPTTTATTTVPVASVAPILSSPISRTLPHLPPVSTFMTPLASKSDTKLPSVNTLNTERFGGGISRYSLDYPDTCVNDDDWRLNLEVWIEKNFPEKFNNLKNMLRFDKPGFELLNDAIFLTELKEQLDCQKSVKPEFNSRISSKMVKRDSQSYPRRASSDYSEVSLMSSPYASRVPQQKQHSHSSPIAPATQLHTPAYPYSNYTYSNIQSPTSPISKTISSSPQKGQSSPTSRSNWNGHHKLDQQPVMLNNHFIHTQTHKGPNHTYTIHHQNSYKRVCISCGTDQSPCWRPSWSVTAGQLCNSCGLRYKKTGARCVEKNCCRIPAKGEWLAMESRGKLQIKKSDGSTVLAYKCLHCGGEVDTKDKK